MKKTRIAILGGGISGLSLGYYLSKEDSYDLLLLEKEGRLGGCIQTEVRGGFLFEKGPRTFPFSRSKDLIELICEVGLEKEMICSSASAKKRYIFANGKLRDVKGAWMLRRLLRPLLKEWAIPPSKEEESVWDFGVRRFGKHAAEYLFDPLVTGILAGDSKKTSLRAAFPVLDAWEKKFGSLTRAFLAQRRVKSSLFSLKAGMSSLIEALRKSFKGTISCNTTVESVCCKNGAIEIATDKGVYLVDQVICALPGSAAAKVFQFAPFPCAGVSIIHVGYRKKLLPFSAFGYLVPSSQQNGILGVLFDSEIFPQQNCKREETRMTVMTRGDLASSVKELQEHLHICEQPNFLSFSSEMHLPQYEFGHLEKMRGLAEKMQTDFPNCTLLGNYLRGASVNECVMSAKSAAEHLLKLSKV